MVRSLRPAYCQSLQAEFGRVPVSCLLEVAEKEDRVENEGVVTHDRNDVAR